MRAGDGMSCEYEVSTELDGMFQNLGCALTRVMLLRGSGGCEYGGGAQKGLWYCQGLAEGLGGNREWTFVFPVFTSKASPAVTPGHM